MKIQDYTEELINLRRHFHQYPELALQEVETSAYIRIYLEKLGYTVTAVEPTGLIAELPCLKKREKLIVLRAEMDALPIQEQTGLPYASVNQGCMHACGHDMILAAALILAKIVAEEQETFPVRMRFLFEPADMTLGMAVHQGQASSMIGSMRIHVYGRSSHWCEAHNGVDAIYGAAQAVTAIHDLNENFGKEHPEAGKYILGTGTIHGGEYTNIIADHVVLNGNIRAVHETTYFCLKDLLEEKLREVEKQTGTRIVIEYPKDPVYAFANDEAFVQIAREVGEKVFGDKFVLEGEDELFLSGDNAYRYFRETGGLFSIFLAGIPQEVYPFHHPKFRLDENILPYSVEALYEMIKKIGGSC